MILSVLTVLCHNMRVSVHTRLFATQVSQIEASAAFDRYHRGNFFLTQPSAGSVPFQGLCTPSD